MSMFTGGLGIPNMSAASGASGRAGGSTNVSGGAFPFGTLAATQTAGQNPWQTTLVMLAFLGAAVFIASRFLGGKRRRRG